MMKLKITEKNFIRYMVFLLKKKQSTSEKMLI